MVSLKDALLRAHEFSGLAGEMPTQDVAILRTLLAVTMTVFYRVNEVGEPAPLETEDDALERWDALWANRIFAMPNTLGRIFLLCFVQFSQPS